MGSSFWSWNGSITVSTRQSALGNQQLAISRPTKLCRFFHREQVSAAFCAARLRIAQAGSPADADFAAAGAGSDRRLGTLGKTDEEFLPTPFLPKARAQRMRSALEKAMFLSLRALRSALAYGSAVRSLSPADPEAHARGYHLARHPSPSSATSALA